jgi:AcrR family transcriptional regulator
MYVRGAAPETANADWSERKFALTTAASRLFATRGYNGAGIDDIGTAMGVSGPALYRHFGSKQAILAAIIAHLADQLVSTIDSKERIDVPKAVSIGIADGNSLVVALRQVSHLQPQYDSDDLRESRARLFNAWVLTINAQGVTAGRWSNLVRARAAAGAVIGLSFAKSGSVAFRTQLASEISQRILSVDLHASLVPSPSSGFGLPPNLASSNAALRREAILAVSSKLFAEKGFNGTSLSDIGSVVGISASAVVRYFTSKEGILAAAFSRLADNITEGLYRELVNDVSPVLRLSNILSNYAALAIRSSSLVALNMTELRCLPAEDQRERRRSQLMYIDELAKAISAVQPHLNELECLLRARATYAMINEVVVDDRLVNLSGLQANLCELAMATATRSDAVP